MKITYCNNAILKTISGGLERDILSSLNNVTTPKIEPLITDGQNQ